MAAVSGGEGDPARAEHAQHVAVREHRSRAARTRELGDHAVGALADVARLLAAGAAVAPQAPVGTQLLDLRCGQTLVLAVVPLEQVLAGKRSCCEACESARFQGTGGWAHEHQLELPACEPRGELRCILAAALGERDVAAAGVAPVKAPPVSAWRTSTAALSRSLLRSERPSLLESGAQRAHRARSALIAAAVVAQRHRRAARSGARVAAGSRAPTRLNTLKRRASSNAQSGCR